MGNCRSSEDTGGDLRYLLLIIPQLRENEVRVLIRLARQMLNYSRATLPQTIVNLPR